MAGKDTAMKVLVVSAAFPPMKAGEADHAYHISSHLARKGVEVDVLTTKGSLPPGDPPFTTHACMNDWSWKDLLRFVYFVRKHAPDVVLLVYIGWIYQDHPMMTFAPTIIKKLLPQCRVVTQFEYPMGCDNNKFSLVTRAVRRAVERWASVKESHYVYGTLLRDSDTIVVLSDRHKKMLVEEDPSANTKVILIPPPPLLTMARPLSPSERRQIRASLGFAEEDIVFVYFGYIYPPKGVETLLHAFHILGKQMVNVRLLLIGGVVAHEYPQRPRFAEEMRVLPKQLGFNDRVIWIGEFETESDQASRFLYAADASVFSHDLGVYLNNSSFAAVAAHGLPIVATRATYVEPAFRDGENLLFCEPKSPESMAAAMLSMAEDSRLRERLQRGASKLAREWFSWDRATGRMLEVLGVAEAADRKAA